MQKFRDMTWQEKKEHVLEYYKFHIYGGLFAVFIVGSILFGVFGPKPPEPAVNVVIMGLYSHHEDELEAFKSDIANSIDKGKHGPVELSIHYVDWDTPSSTTVALNQKLVLMFQAKEIDVMIVEESKFDFYMDTVQECIYEALDDQPELSPLLEKNKEALVKRKASNKAGEKVYGLYSKNSDKLRKIGLGGDFVISVPTVSEKQENAFKTIHWLYESF